MPPTGYPGKKTNNGIGGVTVERAQFEAEKAASDSMYDHETHADPHGQYQKESEKGQANGYASLDGAATIPDAQIPAAIARDTEIPSPATATPLVESGSGAVGASTKYAREDHVHPADGGGGGGGSATGGPATGAKVHRTTHFSVPSGAWTVVPFEGETFDTGGYWDVAAPTRFTVAEAGAYRVYANTLFTPAKADRRFTIVIAKNQGGTLGSVAGGEIVQAEAVSNPAGYPGPVAFSDCVLAAGDYVEVFAFQDTGAAVDMYGAKHTTFFGIRKISSVQQLNDLTDVDTTTIAPTSGNTLVFDAATGLWKPGGYIGAKVYVAADVVVPTATVVAVPLAGEHSDTHNFHDNVTNNTRITIPAGQSGRYQIIGKLAYSAHNTGRRQARIHKNGAYLEHTSHAANSETHIQVVIEEDFVAGDYIELHAYQDSGGDLSIKASTTRYSYLSIRKVA